MKIPLTCSITIITAVLPLLVVGCGDSSEPSSPGGEPAEQHSAPSSSSAARVELTRERLTAYENGLKKEIEAVRLAQERSSRAKTPQERGDAIQASFEQTTIPQGAEAAGLPVDQYRSLRETINGIFRTLDFQGKIDGPLSMDLSRADAATRERLARDPFADLSPAAAAALRAHMDRLVPIWIEYVNLTAVAG